MHKTLESGDIFGELAVLDIELARGASLIALTDLEGYTLEHEDVLAKLKSTPEALDILTENALVQSIDELKRVMKPADEAKMKLLEEKLQELRKRKHRQEDFDLWLGTGVYAAIMGVRSTYTYVLPMDGPTDRPTDRPTD